MDGAISNDFKNKICKSEIVKELLDENEGRPERNDIWLNNTCIVRICFSSLFSIFSFICFKF